MFGKGRGGVGGRKFGGGKDVGRAEQRKIGRINLSKL